MKTRVVSGAQRRLRAFRYGFADRVGGWSLRRQIADLPASRFAIVVAVPMCAHMADMALRRLRGSWPTLCVLNGVSEAEASYLTQRHPGTAFCRVPRMMSHAVVINTLIAELDQPFWLVDHDCLVLDPSILDRGEAESVGRIGAVYFAHINQRNGFHKPQTFLMMLRPVIARRFFGEYSITAVAVRWQRLPAKVREVCLSLGFSQTSYPEEHKRFYDTLVAAAVVAQYNGQGFHCCETHRACFDPHKDAVHFGNTTRPEILPGSRYLCLGAYFWRVSLDWMESAELKTRYLAAHPEFADLESVKAAVLDGNPDINAEVLQIIDSLCAESMKS